MPVIFAGAATTDLWRDSSALPADGAWQRLLKVARTIADVEGEPETERHHLQEAQSYRAIDRLLLHLQKLLA